MLKTVTTIHAGRMITKFSFTSPAPHIFLTSVHVVVSVSYKIFVITLLQIFSTSSVFHSYVHFLIFSDCHKCQIRENCPQNVRVVLLWSSGNFALHNIYAVRQHSLSSHSYDLISWLILIWDNFTMITN